jgi:hypothetical protein
MPRRSRTTREIERRLATSSKLLAGRLGRGRGVVTSGGIIFDDRDARAPTIVQTAPAA